MSFIGADCDGPDPSPFMKVLLGLLIISTAILILVLK